MYACGSCMLSCSSNLPKVCYESHVRLIREVDGIVVGLSHEFNCSRARTVCLHMNLCAAPLCVCLGLSARTRAFGLWANVGA